MEGGDRMPDAPATAVIAAAGFLSAISQVVFLRQILCLYGANEFSLAFFWFFWFASNAAGVRSVFSGGFPDTKNQFPVIDPLHLLWYPAVILFSYSVMLFLPGILRGGGTGRNYLLMSLAVIPLITVQSFLNGRIISLSALTIPGNAGARVFLIESLAFVAGCLLTAAYLSRTSDFILLLLACVPVLFAGILMKKSSAFGQTLTTGKIALTVSIILLAVFHSPLERSAVRTAYPGYELIKSFNTVEGKFDILGTGSERFALFSGKPLVTENEPGADEEAAYPALCQTGKDPSVLIDGMIFTEILPKLNDVSCRKIIVLVRDRAFFRGVWDILPEKTRRILASGRVSVVHKTLPGVHKNQSGKI